MATFTKQQYIEIAGGGLFIALISWLLYHALNKGNETAPVQQPQAVAPTQTNPVTTSALPSIGYMPQTIPSYQDHGGCGCGCGAGQTYDPTISSIIAQTNAALAAMRQSSVATMQTLAQIGNEGGNGMIYYITEDE